MTYPESKAANHRNASLHACRDGENGYCIWRASDFAPVGRVYEYEGAWYWMMTAGARGERGYDSSQAAIRAIRRHYTRQSEGQSE